jgi:hypothetical protein
MGVGGWVAVGMFATFFSLAAYLVVSRKAALKQRQRELTDWARRHDLQFWPGPMDATTFASLPTLATSSTVTSCRASNVARGKYEGMPVAVFDLVRHTRHQRRDHTTFSSIYRTFALFERRECALPWFDFSALSNAGASSLQGKAIGFATSLAAMIGGPKSEDLVPLEGRPGFLLRTKEAAAVRQILSAPVLEFFDQNLGWTVEARDTHVLVGLHSVLRDGWTRPQVEEFIAYQDFDKFLSMAAAIARRF